MQSDNDHSDDIKISAQMECTSSEKEENLLSSYQVLEFNGYVPDEYRSFVIATWLNSLRQGNDMFRLIDKDSYFTTYSKYIETLLNRPNSVIRIAALTDEPDTALGWSLSEGSTLHYVFVKDLREQVKGKLMGESARRKGIASSLIPKDIHSFSHMTKIWLTIWNNKYSKMRFNPFL